MKSQNRPFSYGPWKIIMRNFNPNFRFHLILRCPSLKKLHHLVPLKIHYLHLGGPLFQVNNTAYKIGIIRHYTKGITPTWVQQQNKEGGVWYDVEEYGDPQQPEIWERYSRSQKMKEKDYEDMEILKTKLKALKKEMKIRKNDRELLLLLRLKIEELETEMMEYQRKVENSKMEYCHFLKLSITINGETRTLGVAEYDRPLGLAKKYFDQQFFPREIIVKNVNVEKCKSGAKFLLTQRTLRVDTMVIQNFTEFLLPTVPTHRIKTLEIHEGEVGLQNPFLKSADSLIVNAQANGLLELQNEKVELNNYSNLEFDEVRGLIKNWREQEYPAGRDYKVELQNFEMANFLMTYIKAMDGAVVMYASENSNSTFPHTVVFPMTARTELEVCYLTTQDDNQHQIPYLHFQVNEFQMSTNFRNELHDFLCKELRPD